MGFVFGLIVIAFLGYAAGPIWGFGAFVLYMLARMLDKDRQATEDILERKREERENPFLESEW